MPFWNTSPQLKQISTISPEQQNLVGQSGQGALNLLKQLQGQQFNFDPIANQAQSQYQREIVPSIAERFTSMGSGTQNSSAFSQALSSAGTGLQNSLAALRAQYGLQERGLNQDLLRQLLGVGLTPTFQNYYQPGETGWGTQLLSTLGSATGQAAGMFLPGFGQLSQLGQFGQQRAAASQPSYLGGGFGSGYSGGGLLNPAISGDLASRLGLGVI